MTRLLLILFLYLPVLLPAQGGMWLPMDLKRQNEKEMKALGLKIKADDIYHPENASIMDAICQFDGGCTGEIISPKGLLLTNHHCGFDAIQQLSSLENNYVDNGFWASSMDKELPAEGVTALFIRRMEEVTISVLKGIAPDMAERERQSMIDQNIKELKQNTRLKKGEELLIRPFYEGNKYYMYVTVTYKDVRLVGTPPSSIGKFGSDTDNWVWPRHTGDFSLFRVYMGPDSMPAPYSANNIPLAPRHYLPIAADGAEEGDFTMVYGFPGRTTEYLPSFAVDQIAQKLNPARIEVRDKALKILDAHMRKDPSVKIAYVAKQARMANAWKKWIGESQGLTTYKAADKKRSQEEEFTSRVKNNLDWNYKYGNLLSRMETHYKELEPYAVTRDYFMEVFVRNCEIMAQVAGLNSWIKSYKEQGTPGFASKISSNKAQLADFFKDYKPAVDEEVFASLVDLYASKTPDDWGGKTTREAIQAHGNAAAFARYLFQNSLLANQKQLFELFEKTPGELAQALEKDPAVVFWNAVFTDYDSKVAPKIREIQPVINAMQRQYMAAQMEVFKEKKFFPDANSTLRLTYGQVKGFQPKDGIHYDARTYLDGVIEKFIPGDYEFDVPQKLRALYEAKNYGPYAAKNGKLPVAFLGSNHTTGGNSGSPALDAKGNLVGLNFDRVWEGTMSDVYYDAAICRNIMVDIRYILFIIDKYAGAGHLLEEMKLVYRKKK